jgi:hypothetical protein
MSTTPAKCESCNYNGGSKPNNTTPVGPIVPGVNYDFNLDSTSIPENLLDYFIKVLEQMNLNATIVTPLKPKLKRFFDAHKYGDYRLGSLLLAFCIIVECFCKQRETRDYRVPIVHLMKDHLERSGYACGGSVAVDVYFMEVI